MTSYTSPCPHRALNICSAEFRVDMQSGAEDLIFSPLEEVKYIQGYPFCGGTGLSLPVNGGVVLTFLGCEIGLLRVVRRLLVMSAPAVDGDWERGHLLEFLLPCLMACGPQSPALAEVMRGNDSSILTKLCMRGSARDFILRRLLFLRARITGVSVDGLYSGYHHDAGARYEFGHDVLMHGAGRRVGRFQNSVDVFLRKMLVYVQGFKHSGKTGLPRRQYFLFLVWASTFYLLRGYAEGTDAHRSGSSLFEDFQPFEAGVWAVELCCRKRPGSRVGFPLRYEKAQALATCERYFDELVKRSWSLLERYGPNSERACSVDGEEPTPHPSRALCTDGERKRLASRSPIRLVLGMA